MKNNPLDTSPWHQREARAPLSLLPLILFSLISGIAGVALGKYLINEEAFQALSENRQLLDESRLLNGENLELKRQISIHENSSKIDRVSVEKTQSRLSALQKELGETREKLAFYKRIILPEKSIEGVQIRAFRLIGGLENSKHRYILTLSQGASKTKEVKGIVSIKVNGRENGVEKSLDLKELDQEKKTTLSFQFRYLQSFTRSFSWPENFVPEKVSIELKTSGKKSKKIEQTWQWRKLEEQALLQ